MTGEDKNVDLTIRMTVVGIEVDREAEVNWLPDNKFTELLATLAT